MIIAKCTGDIIIQRIIEAAGEVVASRFDGQRRVSRSKIWLGTTCAVVRSSDRTCTNGGRQDHSLVNTLPD